MRKVVFRTVPLLVATTLVLCPFGTANATHGGRLVVWRIPGLGNDLFVGVEIDGRHAANMPYGHHFETVLSPGRHVITVQPFPRIYAGAASSVVINVRPGDFYNFTVKGSVRQLFLSSS